MVELAGCRHWWRFVGSTPIQEVLARRPWELDELKVIRARVEPAAGAARVIAAVEQAIRGVDIAGALRLLVDSESPRELGALLERLHNISPAVTGRRRLVAVAGAIERPTAWVLWHDGDGVGLEADLFELLDGVSKVARVPLPLVVLLHTRGLADRHDLSVGLPVEVPLVTSIRSRAELWCSYVHWRMAWMAGGRLGLAEQLGQQVWPSLEPENDVALELALSDAAVRWWSDTTDDLQNGLRRWLRDWPKVDAQLGADLSTAHLLWAPAHDAHRGLQPSPWVARALLCENPDASNRSLLRVCDTCEPLSMASLMRCLRLEAALKASLERQHRGVPEAWFGIESEAQKMRELHDRLLLVPRENPAAARSLLDFAGLGFTCSRLPDRRTSDLARGLRDVRNSLAHGHPPSWKMLLMVSELWNRLPR